MIFGVLYLTQTLPGEQPANEDIAAPRAALIERAPAARAVAVALPGERIKVRLLDAAEGIWHDAMAIRAAAGARPAQVGLSKLQAWIGPVQFPMFAHHDAAVSTLRIPRFDPTVVEVGSIGENFDLDQEPPFTGSDTIALQVWIKAHLL